MLVSLNWIKEFTKLPDLLAKDLSSKLTLSTAEVESTKEVNKHLQNIKVVEVVKVNPHPNADKLKLVTFRISDKKTSEVVCGANNVVVSMKAAYAPEGTTLPGGLTLTKREIRGVISSGMLCSKAELGLENGDEDGIWHLDDNFYVGDSLLNVLNKKEDILFDIDNKSLTHRPDLWGCYGMAREFAAIFKTKLKDPYDSQWIKKMSKKANTKTKSPIAIEVKKGSAGICYYALSISGVKVKESPDFIKDRLQELGYRSINNLVDVSNYVMLELGIPLHIFDRKKIKGDKLIIKKLQSDYSFTTLDEQIRPLKADDTVICDRENILCLAGIMGGVSSSVDDETTDILIEVANWSASDIRRTSTRLSLRTEASLRYEKSLDSHQCLKTLLRTLELVLDLCPKAYVVGKIQYDGEDLKKYKQRVLDISLKKISNYLSHDILKNDISLILKSLGFKLLKGSSKSFKIEIPSFRAGKDIQCDADIIEEIGRIVGYDNIGPIAPYTELLPVDLSNQKRIKRKICKFLTYHTAALEVQTYPLVGERWYKKCQFNLPELQILNPISRDHKFMRNSLIPSALDILAKNVKHFSNFCFFELGRVYLSGDKSFAYEQNHLCVVSYDSSESCFLKLQGNIYRLLNNLNLSTRFIPKYDKNDLIDENFIGIHPHEFMTINIRGKNDGVIFSLHPILMENLKIKGEVSISVLNLSTFESTSLNKHIKYNKLNKYPGADFDYTLDVDNNCNVGDILDVLKKLKLKEVIDHKIVDIFKRDSRKFITLKTSFLDKNATIGSDKLKDMQEKIVFNLKSAGYNLKN